MQPGQLSLPARGAIRFCPIDGARFQLFCQQYHGWSLAEQLIGYQMLLLLYIRTVLDILTVCIIIIVKVIQN